MTTITKLAEEFGVQPYEVAAFGDLGTYPQDAELDAETEATIREAWAAAAATPNREDTCNAPAADCVCCLPPGHGGPHRCGEPASTASRRCDGEWLGTGSDDFQAVKYPGGIPATPEGFIVALAQAGAYVAKPRSAVDRLGDDILAAFLADDDAAQGKGPTDRQEHGQPDG